MRTSWIQSAQALPERMSNPSQVVSTQPEAGMPPYLESFLAHLTLLVGVPFDYLVPDERLLPDESIRFFYLDPSWTDRLVDGVFAVGQTGTRAQAHYHAHAPAVHQQLDQTQRVVRPLQRALANFSDLKSKKDGTPAPAATITGFLLRSQAVSGWPQMDVRAYDTNIREPFDPSDSNAQLAQLPTLRLELLSPGLMIALFQGVPSLVILEEPHHGVQFGVHLNGDYRVYVRDKTGQQVTDSSQNKVDIPLPVRAAHSRVVHVTELRRRLFQARAPYPVAVEQTGSASFAISVLSPPWRQRFEDAVDRAGTQNISGGFVPHLNVAVGIANKDMNTAFQRLVVANAGK